METQKQIKQNRLWQFLLLVVLVMALFSLLGDVVAWLIRLRGGIFFGVPHAATIGIIGGADGPTAIFVTASSSPFWQILLKLSLLILSLLGLYHLRKRK